MAEHANIVKNLHKSLRHEVKSGQSEKEVWDKLISNKDALKEYSKSMHALATIGWHLDKNNRIYWCKEVLKQYFEENGLEKSVKRELKTKLFEELRTKGVSETDEEKEKIEAKVYQLNIEVAEPLGKKILLDVGSCYNPFKILYGFHCIAIDISPATEDVLHCDFLNLNIKNDRNEYCGLHEIKDDLKRNVLRMCTFDVVVFSLLLSYFPSPQQRLKCCINAYHCLHLHGILLIITPDSSHQNKHVAMMKSWKKALELIGFTRFKYEKLDHLHCMAYRKSKDDSVLDNLFDKLSDAFFIPQDFQEIEEESQNINTSLDGVTYDSEVFAGLSI